MANANEYRDSAHLSKMELSGNWKSIGELVRKIVERTK